MILPPSLEAPEDSFLVKRRPRRRETAELIAVWVCETNRDQDPATGEYVPLTDDWAQSSADEMANYIEDGARHFTIVDSVNDIALNADAYSPGNGTYARSANDYFSSLCRLLGYEVVN